MSILIGHLIGDILLQNKWLGRMKMTTWWGMMLHCFIASLAVVACCGWWDWRAALVFSSHWAIDTFAIGKRFWPDFIRQGNPKTGEAAPEWLRLMDDQSLHLVCYWIIGLL